MKRRKINSKFFAAAGVVVVMAVALLLMATAAYAQAATSKGAATTQPAAQPGGVQVTQAATGNESDGDVTGSQGTASSAPSGSSRGPLAAGSVGSATETEAIGSAASSAQPLTPEGIEPLPDSPEPAGHDQQTLQVSSAGGGTVDKGKASDKLGSEVNGTSPSSADSGQKDKTASQKQSEPAPKQEQQNKKEHVSLIAKFTGFFKRLFGRR